MTWKFEILRCLFVAFGFFEILCNGSYLLRGDGITKARGQHKELPSYITDRQMKCKVICMLLSGVIFFAAGLSSCILHKELSLLFIVVSALLSLYALIEALYYKYVNTFGFFIVSVILLVVCIL